MFSPFGGLPAEEVDAALSEYAKTLPKDERKGFKERFWETNIGGLLQSIAGAVTLPGDVYAGKVDPMSDEAIGRSFELAGLLNVGSGAVPAKPNELRAGIKAYHGSPHDFDRFDMSKIGTGEGAQAYGHGLYFAGNEAVAKEYKKALGGKNVIDGINAELAQLAKVMQDDAIPGQYRKFRTEAGESAARAYDDLMAKRSNLGHMYEVELQTSPERLLDWDKPLSQHDEKAKASIRDAMENIGLSKTISGYVVNSDQPGRVALSTISRGEYNPNLMPADGHSAAMASNALREAGIDGIKYLDGGSRGAGQGSSNYVMFDDKLIKVLRKYGVATLAALPAAGLFELGLTPEDVQQVN